MGGEDGKHLRREWIDWKLFDKTHQMWKRHYDKKESTNVAGESIATITTILVSQVLYSQTTPEHKMQILADVVRFISDLASHGWDREQLTRKPN
jgi:uncharacterized membrane protein YesL